MVLYMIWCHPHRNVASKGRGSLAQWFPSSALSQFFPISAAFAPTPAALAHSDYTACQSFPVISCQPENFRSGCMLPDPLSVIEPSVLTCTSGQSKAMELLPASHGLGSGFLCSGGQWSSAGHNRISCRDPCTALAGQSWH